MPVLYQKGPNFIFHQNIGFHKIGGRILNDWNYTKKAVKAGLLYALSGIIYYYALMVFLDPDVYEECYIAGGICFFILSMSLLLYFPFLIVPDFFSGLVTDPVTAVLSLLIVITVIAAFIGFLLDLRAESGYRKSKEKPGEKAVREAGVFLHISGESGKPVVINEKLVNYCIISGFVIIAVLFIVDFTGIADNYEPDGFYSRPPDELSIYKKSGTFREELNGTKETGTYEVNGSLLTLYYSDGKIAEYYLEQKIRVLRPANRSRFIGVEYNENCYVKPHLS